MTTTLFPADSNGRISAHDLSRVRTQVNNLLAEINALEYRGFILHPDLTDKVSQLMDAFSDTPSVADISRLYTEIRDRLHEYHG